MQENEKQWHALAISQVESQLKTNIENGLSAKESLSRLEQYGGNKLTEKKRKSPIYLVFEQFNDLIIWILIAAAVINYATNPDEYIGSIVIAMIVVLNAVLGFAQTYRAAKALEALKELSAPLATVLRDGKPIQIPTQEIIPGDVLLLESGDKVAADARVVHGANLAVIESALTGESGAASKTTEPIEGALALGDQKNMVFAGTAIARGRGKAIVVATGDKSQLGKIAGFIQDNDEKTPLQIELKKVGFVITIGIIVMAAIFFVVGMLKGNNAALMLLASVSLAVAAIPEGLPAIITATMALGVSNMARKNAIVRRLHSVEALGATNYICSDKTGTITLNKMTVKQIYIEDKLAAFTSDISLSQDKTLLFTAATLANDSQLKEDGNYHGDPTETALVEAAELVGLKKSDLENIQARETEIPFESERKMMTSINKKDTETFAYAKGASEVILEKCSQVLKEGCEVKLTAQERTKVIGVAEDLASQGYRVLALSCRNLKDGYDINKVEESMTFIGLMAMIDPPREEVKASLSAAHNAGISVAMITGDHAKTAESIAREIGLLTNKRVMNGAELENISQEELEKIVEEVGVYARVNPIDKLKIVKALQNCGHIVAMTGDGVNDAPALKKANVGVAMGITGTDVSKEAADMILADDNFATILSAVKEGRAIFDNLKKFINFLLSCNTSIVLTMFFGTILIPAGSLPLLPIQILWINLVTNGLPALALGVDPAEKGIMKRKPRTDEEAILSKKSITLIVIYGCILTIASFGIFLLSQFVFKYEPRVMQTMVFTTLVISQMLHSLNYRSFFKSVFTLEIFKNKMLNFAIVGSIILQLLVIYLPFFNTVFKTAPLNLFQWGLMLGLIIIVEIIIDRVKVVTA